MPKEAHPCQPVGAREGIFPKIRVKFVGRDRWACALALSFGPSCSSGFLSRRESGSSSTY